MSEIDKSTLYVIVINGMISLNGKCVPYVAHILCFKLHPLVEQNLFSAVSLLPLHKSLNCLSACPSLSPSSRAQEVFRQAMRSPVVRLEVVPSSNRERYEKSLIGQLFGTSAGPDSSPRIAKTKEPPPPVKAKPVFKPSENPAMRLAEEAAPMEATVGVSCILQPSNNLVVLKLF